VTADALDPVDRLLAERECERLIIDFVRRLDLGEPGSVAELFTPDGIREAPVTSCPGKPSDSLAVDHLRLRSRHWPKQRHAGQGN
jgi:hypothetical protein